MEGSAGGRGKGEEASQRRERAIQQIGEGRPWGRGKLSKEDFGKLSVGSKTPALPL